MTLQAHLGTSKETPKKAPEEHVTTETEKREIVTLNFIDEFKRWVVEGEITDAPDMFLELSALQILSMAISRKRFVRFGRALVYPNLWVCLIARSSVFRKSTCLGFVNDFLRKLGNDFIYPDTFSGESIIQELSNKSIGTWLVDELGVLLKTFHRDYAGMGPIQPMLTKLFDCEQSHTQNLIKGRFNITSPFISIFSLTAPAWLQKSLTEDDIQGGFFVRFILAYCNEKSRYCQFPKTGDDELKVKLVEMMRDINRYDPLELHFSGGAHTILKTFSNEIEEQVREANDEMSSFLSRIFVTSVKLSILYHLASIERKSKAIGTESAERAVKFAKELLESTKRICGLLAFNPYQQARQKVLEQLRSIPVGDNGFQQLRFSQIARRMKMPTFELTKLIDGLEIEERIKKAETGNNGKDYIIQLIESGNTEGE